MRELEWKNHKYRKNTLKADAIAQTIYIINIGLIDYDENGNELLGCDTDLIYAHWSDDGSNDLFNFGNCINVDDAKEKCQQHHDAMIWEWLSDSKPKVSNQRIITL